MIRKIIERRQNSENGNLGFAQVSVDSENKLAILSVEAPAWQGAKA